jgi:hypothetical protein
MKLFDRQRGGVAQRAYGAAGDIVGHVNQQIEVFVPALAVLDGLTTRTAIRSLPAWRALTAGFSK